MLLKSNARFAQTPIVMLSSKDSVFDIARGRMVGCEDYLTKPFTKDQLLHTINTYVKV
jgi:twitching motility two-component system response regulator PilG